MAARAAGADTLIHAAFEEHLAVAQVTEAAVAAPLRRLITLSADALRAGGKLMFFGNGGSAADAQHLATEFTVRYSRNRPALAALALTTDSSALTAIGNDFQFDDIFARQVEALARPGDVAIGISTSGKSRNVIRALLAATARHCVAAAFTGGDGGSLGGIADPLIIVPSTTTARIQEMHILIGQILCHAVEHELGHG